VAAVAIIVHNGCRGSSPARAGSGSVVQYRVHVVFRPGAARRPGRSGRNQDQRGGQIHPVCQPQLRQLLIVPSAASSGYAGPSQESRRNFCGWNKIQLARTRFHVQNAPQANQDPCDDHSRITDSVSANLTLPLKRT